MHCYDRVGGWMRLPNPIQSRAWPFIHFHSRAIKTTTQPKRPFTHIHLRNMQFFSSTISILHLQHCTQHLWTWASCKHRFWTGTLNHLLNNSLTNCNHRTSFSGQVLVGHKTVNSPWISHRYRFRDKPPAVGICLGHQAIGLASGFELVPSPIGPVHGTPVKCIHNQRVV